MRRRAPAPQTLHTLKPACDPEAMTMNDRTDRYARYLFSALVVLAATLAGLLVHASQGIQVIA